MTSRFNYTILVSCTHLNIQWTYVVYILLCHCKLDSTICQTWFIITHVMFWIINTCRGCMVHATTQLVVVVVVALVVLSLSCQECQRQMHNVWTCIPHFGNTLVIVKWCFDICQIVIMWISFIQMQKISNSCCDRQTKKKKHHII